MIRVEKRLHQKWRKTFKTNKRNTLRCIDSDERELFNKAPISSTDWTTGLLPGMQYEENSFPNS